MQGMSGPTNALPRTVRNGATRRPRASLEKPLRHRSRVGRRALTWIWWQPEWWRAVVDPFELTQH